MAFAASLPGDQSVARDIRVSTYPQTDMRLLWVLLGLCAALADSATTTRDHRALLVVSFDGFRPDYLGRGWTPVLDGLRAHGSRAPYMHNVFPTKTFPNHHSIATGLYPESHGVLGNSVYDVASNRRFGYGPQLYSSPDVTPIWTLNQMAGGGRHSGIMMWPGGEFSYNGVLPTFRQPYDLQVGWESRVDTVVSWLVHPSMPVNLVMVYFEEPDRRAHAFGPDSPEVHYHIQKLDNITRYLRKKLADHNLMDRVNVVQLSDHGMEAVTLARIINITDFVGASQFKMIDTSPVIQLFPVKGKEDSVYRALKTASGNRHFKIYRKAEVPDRWHYKNSPRAPPLLLVADHGYAFDDIYAAEAQFIKEWHITPSPNMVFGLHGYDNNGFNMRPYFLAWGPLIRKNYSISPFNTVDLYYLFSRILQLTPPATNGTATYVTAILTNRT